MHHGTKLVWRWKIRHHKRVRVEVRVRYAKTEYRSECSSATLYVQVIGDGTPASTAFSCNAYEPPPEAACDSIDASLLANGYEPPPGTTTMTVATPGGEACSSTSVDSLFPNIDCYLVMPTGEDVTVTFSFADGPSVAAELYVPATPYPYGVIETATSSPTG